MFSTNLEVSKAFLFRENRRHWTDGRTDRQTDRRKDGRTNGRVQHLTPPPTEGCTTIRSAISVYAFHTQSYQIWEDNPSLGGRIRESSSGFAQNNEEPQSLFKSLALH